MSKKKDYTRYSKPDEVEDIVLNNEVVEEAAVTEPEPPEEPKYGIVDNCTSLYVRSKPHKNADPICTLDYLSEVMVNLNESNDVFYKVYTASGIEGYCMKDFIKLH